MGSTLTKHDLARQLAAETRFLWMTQKAAVDIVETMMDLLVLHFQNGGEQITLRGFGSFKIRRRKAFLGTDPRTGIHVDVPARASLAFKPSRETVSRINQ